MASHKRRQTGGHDSQGILSNLFSVQQASNLTSRLHFSRLTILSYLIDWQGAIDLPTKTLQLMARKSIAYIHAIVTLAWLKVSEKVSITDQSIPNPTTRVCYCACRRPNRPAVYNKCPKLMCTKQNIHLTGRETPNAGACAGYHAPRFRNRPEFSRMSILDFSSLTIFQPTSPQLHPFRSRIKS